jgi:predicted nucleic acid-binding protein
LPEAGASEVRSVLIAAAGRGGTVRAVASRLAYPEGVAALTRAEAAGRLTTEEAEEAVRELAKSFGATGKPLYEVIEPVRVLVEHAAGLARRHRLRGFDAVHLATALAARNASAPGDELTFMVTDEELAAAARAEGLTVDDLS